MEARMKNLLAIAIGLVALLLPGCSSSEDEPAPEPQFVDGVYGYFHTICGVTAQVLVDGTGGEATLTLYSTESESVIPIQMIAPDVEMFKSPALWADQAVYPAHAYTNAGVVRDYPNSLDVMFSCGWAKFATRKLTDSDKGVLKVVFEPNPTEDFREMAIMLGNEKKSNLVVIQVPKSYVPKGNELDLTPRTYTGQYHHAMN